MANQTISFTLSEVFAFLGGFFGIVVSAGAAFAVIAKIWKKIKEPNTMQDTRIKALEDRATNTDKMLDNDNRRLTKLESESILTLRAVLALLKHSINGNDTAAMKDSMDRIEYFLVNGKLKP